MRRCLRGRRVTRRQRRCIGCSDAAEALGEAASPYTHTAMAGGASSTEAMAAGQAICDTAAATPQRALSRMRPSAATGGKGERQRTGGGGEYDDAASVAPNARAAGSGGMGEAAAASADAGEAVDEVIDGLWPIRAGRKRTSDGVGCTSVGEMVDDAIDGLPTTGAGRKRQRDVMGGEDGRQGTGDGAQGGSAGGAGSATGEATTHRISVVPREEHLGEGEEECVVSQDRHTRRRKRRARCPKPAARPIQRAGSHSPRRVNNVRPRHYSPRGVCVGIVGILSGLSGCRACCVCVRAAGYTRRVALACRETHVWFKLIDGFTSSRWSGRRFRVAFAFACCLVCVVRGCTSVCAQCARRDAL